MERIYLNVIFENLDEIWLIPKTVDVLCNLAHCGCKHTGAGRGTQGAFLRSAGQHASLTVVLFRYSCLISCVFSLCRFYPGFKKRREKTPSLYKKDYVLWKACDIRKWPVGTDQCIIHVRTHACVSWTAQLSWLQKGWWFTVHADTNVIRGVN